MAEINAIDAMEARKRSCLICEIPNELVKAITSYLGQADLKCLAETCRTLAVRVRPLLLQWDIQDNIYNSLAWACFYGDTALGASCLKQGASPNIYFFMQAPESNWGYKIHPYNIMHYHGDIPHIVGPTKKVSKVPLLFPAEFSSCSALSLATKRDHLEMVQLLLDAGADVVHKQELTPEAIPQFLYHPSRNPYVETQFFSHESSLCHVRSVQVAEILFEAGGADFINYAGRSGFTPLELFLASCSQYQFRGSTDITEEVLCSLVELFLRRGASNERWSCHSGCLVAAISTGYISVVRLLVNWFQPDFENRRVDDCQAIITALGGQTFVDDDLPLSDVMKARLLRCFLEAGVSPNTIIPDLGSLLSIAIEHQSYDAVKILSEWNVDLNLTNPRILAPLAAEVFAHHHTPPAVGDLLTSLYVSGADINQPSFWPNGFTPLMFATGDTISHEIFADLIRLGASRDEVRALSPSSPMTTILQCILTGFPVPRLVNHTEVNFFFLNHLYQLKIDDGLLQNDKGNANLFQLEHMRELKFRHFLQPGVTPAHFYTHEGRHIVHWAIENLYYYELEWALTWILPHYAHTKLPSDNESPLWTLFSSTRMERYLTVGTLTQTYRLSQAMVKAGGVPRDVKDNEETILHRVCKLRQTFPDRAVWNEAERCTTNLDFDADLSESAIDWCLLLELDGPPQQFPQPEGFRSLGAAHAAYMNRRLYMIGKIVELLARSGLDLYAEDGDGKTPFEYIIDSRVLRTLPLHVRNLKKEAQILGNKIADT